MPRRRLVLQSVHFARMRWTQPAAYLWLKAKHLKASGLDKGQWTLRYRQRSPGDFRPGSLRTVVLGQGVEYIMGHLQPKGDK